MSAIFGIINKHGEAITEADVITMQQSLLHRAIDGKGFLINGEIMFGHHKLTVHRRQTYEQQPLVSDDCIITSDARIDNIDELTKDLELDPQLNITDSLIILKAYEKWGNDCTNHLEGEFAFAIWNKQTKTFYGASDHIGFRTFYYYENSEIFAFASEIKALETIKTEPLEINKEIFFNAISGQHQPITYDKKIYVLQAAHYLLLPNNDDLHIKQYWVARLTKKYKFRYGHQWHSCLLELITKKIKCQIDSDYPIGIMLSGGLDSSFVAAIACKLLKEKGRKLIAFASALPHDYKGEDKDERFYIEKLKERFDNLEVHYISVPEDIGPYSDLNEAFSRVEAPLTTFHYVVTALFRAAKEHNVRTLLTGFGGDMTISYKGYGIIYQYLLGFRLLKTFRLFTQLHKLEKDSLVSLMKTEIFNYMPLYRKVRDYIKPTLHQSYYPFKKEIIKRMVKAARIPNNKQHFQERLNQGEIGAILLYFRKQTNGFNLEFLSPVLGKEINELFFDIPGKQLILNGIRRGLVKKAMKNLVPKEITERIDKMPFSPDYNKRIAKINAVDVGHLLKHKNAVEKSTGIDMELLLNLISKINRSEIKSAWQINNELFYIPIAIIPAEFYLYLYNKAYK